MLPHHSSGEDALQVCSDEKTQKLPRTNQRKEKSETRSVRLRATRLRCSHVRCVCLSAGTGGA